MCRRPSLLSVAVVCIILSAGPSLAVECPFLYSELGGRCLLFRPNLALTWPNADTFCRSTNGSLAIVDDCTLLGQVARHIDNNADLTPDQGYWIGGTDEGSEGNFTWVDGSEVPLHMPFWGTYYIQEEVYPEPNGGVNQNCLGLLSSDRYYFHDVECERQMAVLCEAPGKNVTEVTTLNARADGTNDGSIDVTRTVKDSPTTNTVPAMDTAMTPATTTSTVPATTTTTVPATDTTMIPDTTTITVSATTTTTVPATDTITVPATDTTMIPDTTTTTVPATTTTTVPATDTTTVPATTTTTVPATDTTTVPATATTMIPDTSSTTAPCPPDYALVGVACFKFFNASLVSWSVADRLCINNGGSLATLDDCDMLADVAEYIDENGLQPVSLGYWIGATDVESEGLFRWTEDDSIVPLRMPFWGTGQGGPEPNGLDIENCVILDASDRYFFHDVMCSNEKAVLCRAPGLMRLQKPRKNDC